MEYNNNNNNNNNNQINSRCLTILFDLIGVQQRHLCLGAIICCLSGGIIISEFQNPSPYYSGYWMGTVDLIAALFIFFCAVKPIKPVFVISGMLDAVAVAINFAGSIQLLAVKNQPFTTGWVGLGTCVFLLYHSVSCAYDSEACCNLKARNEVENTTSNENEERQAEEGRREERRRRRRSQSPPIDFRLPDEMPKLPGYDELSKSEGLPPDYDNLSVAPPEYTPPDIVVTINGETYM